MRIKKTFFIASLLLGSVALAGCSDEKELRDGEWPPIQFTVNEVQCKTSVYKVGPDGGEYKVSSSNYDNFWINSIWEDSLLMWPEGGNPRPSLEAHLTTDWYEVQYDIKCNLVVSIQPKTKDSPSRSLQFRMQSGDGFGTITLSQE